MEAKQELRALFLAEFAKRLVIYTKYTQYQASQKLKEDAEYHGAPYKISGLFEKLEKSLPKQKMEEAPEVISSLPPAFPQAEQPMQKAITPLAPRVQVFPAAIRAPAQPMPRIVEVAELPPPRMMFLPGKIPSFRKIDYLLADPSVQSLECAGPGRQITIKRNGLIQATPVVLSIEEIKNMLKELSEKTKIPIISGLFKVSFQNLLMTAIISDFVDPKFIIQKRMLPFHPAPYPAR
jgi:hypothetical protein